MQSSLPMHQARRCRARSKRSGKPCRSPAVRGFQVCRMHGAGGGAPKGNCNALKHGALHEQSDPIASLSQSRIARQKLREIDLG